MDMQDIFSHSGALSAHLTDFVPRDGQIAMAAAVENPGAKMRL